MSTRDEKVNIFQKKFMTRDNFTDNFLEFLLKHSKDHFKTIYGQQGFFNGGTLSGTAPDEFTVETPSLATDGQGNLLDIDPSNSVVTFENEVTSVYSIGLRYVPLPKDTEVNVRTGQIEYRVIEDAIGELKEPDSVVDLGTTLRVSVNSVTEVNVDNTGRQVRVFLKRALGQADAFFDAIVQYDGTDNFIETTNLLGQTAGLVSVNPADYQVFLFGPLVKKNTDLSIDPNVAFLGTVTGAGAGVTPTVFDQTGLSFLPSLVPTPGTGLLAQILTLVEGGGTISHDPGVLGRVAFSQDLLIRPLGSNADVTVLATSIDLADDEVAFVQLPTPFSTQTLSLQSAPRSTLNLAQLDRFWIFHRHGSVINVRGGLQLEQGEQRQLEDIVIGNSIFFSDDDRVRFNETDNVFHFDVDGGDSNGDLAIGEKVFYGNPTAQNFTSYVSGLLSVLFNNLTQDASVLTGLFRSERDNGSDSSFESKVVADTENRFSRTIDGAMSWGDGTVTADVSLLRDAVGFLSLVGSLRVSNGIVNAGDFANNDLFQFVDGVTPQWELVTDGTVRAIIDELGNITASNDLISTQDVSAGRNVLATEDVQAILDVVGGRDVLTGSATAYADAQGIVVPKSSSLNEVDDESLGRKLLRTSPNTPADSVINIAPSTVLAGDGSKYALPVGTTVSNYSGGTVDFTTGTVTGGGVNFAPPDFSSNPNEWLKFAISLQADNTILITPGLTFGATQDAASDPLLPSGAVSSTLVAVQDNGAAGLGTILPIIEANFIRLPAAGGGGSAGGGDGGGAPIEPEEGFEAALIDKLIATPGTPESNIDVTFTNGTHNPDGLINLSCDKSLTGTSSFIGGVDESQLLSFGSVPDGGVYRLTHEGNETVDIPAGSNAATLIGFLEALPSIDTGTLNISGDEITGFTIDFTLTEGGQNQPELTVTLNTLFINVPDPFTNDESLRTTFFGDGPLGTPPLVAQIAQGPDDFVFIGGANLSTNPGKLTTQSTTGGARIPAAATVNLENIDPQIGTIRFKWTPDAAGGFRVFFEVTDPSGNSSLVLQRQPSGDITYQAFDTIGLSFVTLNFGNPGLVAGTEVEVEFSYDFNAGAQRLFIDGVQQGATDTQTIGRTNTYPTATTITIGSTSTGLFAGDWQFDDLQIFKSIQHTANFMSEIPRALAPDPIIESFRATYDAAVLLDFSTSTTGGSVNLGATIAGGKLVIPSGAFARYNNAQCMPKNVGAIRLKWTPDFTGNPASVMALFDALDTVNSTRVRIAVDASGNLSSTIANALAVSTSGVFPTNITSLIQTGVEMEIELNFDIAGNTQTIFVDGLSKGTLNNLAAVTPTQIYNAGVSQIDVGNDGGTNPSTGEYDDVQIFKTIQHTSDFVGEIPRVLGSLPVTATPSTPQEGITGNPGVALTSAPSFTVVPGDILFSFDLNEFRRIITVTDQQNYIFDSPFSGSISAGSVMVSQAVWTLNLLSIGDPAEETRFLDLFGARDIDEIQVAYEDSIVTGDLVPDLNKEARLVVSASNSGLLLDTGLPASDSFGDHQARPTFPDTINNYALLNNATKERVFVLFFCNPNNVSITSSANLIKYKTSIYRRPEIELGGFLDSGFIISDGTGANGIASISSVFDSGLGINVTEVALDFTFVPNVSEGKVDGELEVIAEGLTLPRIYTGVDAAKTLYYSEIGNKRVRFSADLTGSVNSIHIRKLRPGQGGSTSTGNAQLTGVTEVTSEAELILAISTVPPEVQIRIAASFEVNAPIVIDKSNIQIAALHQGLVLSTAVGFTGTEVFDIPAAIEKVTLRNLSLVSSIDVVDGFLIRDTAKENRIENCRINLPNTTSKSAIHVEGQENHILGNRIDCGGSVASPGCIFLDVTSSDNLVATNIIS